MGSPVVTEVSKTTLSGYVDTSAIWGFGDVSENYFGRTNDGDGYVDGFNLNVVQLSLASPMGSGEWAAGYQVDLWLGPDAHWLGSYSAFQPSQSDIGIKQAYVNLMAPVGNGLELKMGHFDTIIGYEVGSSPLNPNFSRSYGFFIEPFQHTGLLASYPIAEGVTVSGGVANTYGFGINDRWGESEDLAYMGAMGYEIPEGMGALSGGTLSGGFVRGLVTGADLDKEKTSYYAGATLPTPIENLSVGASFDYASDYKPGVDEWALAGYASYMLGDGRATLSGRVDYYNTEFYFNRLDGKGMVARDRHDVSYLGLTGTISYQLWDNVLSRIEGRWDQAMDEHLMKGFGLEGDEDSATTLLLNVVYQF